MSSFIPAKLRIWLASLVFLTLLGGLGWYGYRLLPESASSLRPTVSEMPAEGTIVCRGYVSTDPPVNYLPVAQAGIVSHVQVEEGDQVSAEAILLEMESTLADSRVRAAKEAVRAAEIQIRKAKKLAERRPLQLAQQQAVIDSGLQRVEAAKIMLDRQKRLSKKQVFSETDIRASEAQFKQLQEMQKVYENQLKELKLHDPGLDRELAESNRIQAEEQLKQANYFKEKMTLRAPVSGKVLRVLVQPGQTLSGSPDQPAIVFLPEGRQTIQVKVEQELVSRVFPNQAVVITDDTNAAGKWTGKVDLIGDWFGPQREAVSDPYRYQDVRLLECRVKLDPDQPKLRLGQRVRVVFLRK